MMRALRHDAHLLQRQADLPTHVFALVLRGDIHIGGAVVRNARRLAVFIQLEEIEFHF